MEETPSSPILQPPSRMTRLWSRMPGPVRRHPWRTGIGAVAVVLVALIGWRMSQPVQPEYVTALAEKGDLTQTVEAVGTVISDRDLKLQFSMSGIVDRLLVKEGDTVKAGQRLVTLRAGNLSASVASASASVQQAEAQLRLLEEGSRPEDIVIAEAELQNKQASLAAAQESLKNAEASLKTAEEKLRTFRREADVSLSGDVTTVGTTVSSQMVTLNTSLSIIDDVFDDVDVQDVIIQHNISSYTFLQQQQRNAEAAVVSVQRMDLSPDDFSDALVLLEEARRAAQMTNDTVARAYDVIVSLPLTGNFTTAVRESHKATLSAEKASVQGSLATISSELTGLQNASAGLNTQITAEEANVVNAKGAKEKALADIRTYETSVRISQAQLDRTRAGARPADIDAARARVQAARADLARAASQYNDTILTAPIDGVITKVNLKEGESLSTSFASEPPVTMLGASPYRVEMFVAEIDVPKTAVGQKATLELDAFRGKPFELRVGEIDPVSTDRDGVSKYRVKLDFTETPQDIRVGMTGDAAIVTGFAGDVVSVPLRAVLDRPDGSRYVRVLAEDGRTLEERNVTVGMEAQSGQVAVEGVNEGETVVVLIRQ